jgi:P4 family phage/plasmid primase-like protien
LEWSTGLLLPHDPAVLSTIQLPGDWAPTATCPAFDAFLAQVVPEDVIPLVWELIGYMMYDGNPFHKAGMLDGSGRNGKGTFLRNLEALLGHENVASISLKDLTSERFATSGLFGKLANIVGDIDGTYIENTAMFKAVTGQDMVRGEYKYKDQFSFTPRAVPIFSANKIPGSADVTTGYLSRWLVIPFPNSFLGKEDRGLDARLSTPEELAGIAVKGVYALQGLMKRGNFIETESSRAAFDAFRRKINQVESWLHECCERNPRCGHINRTTLFQAYQRWAEEGHVGKLRRAEFYSRLDQAGLESATVRGNRGYKGLRLLPDEGSAATYAHAN